MQTVTDDITTNFKMQYSVKVSDYGRNIGIICRHRLNFFIPKSQYTAEG
jgi:hypothetical protein